MPYFKWSGINLMGKVRQGKRFAKSQNDLDALLFKRDIALLSCAPARAFWVGPISLSLKI